MSLHYTYFVTSSSNTNNIVNLSIAYFLRESKFPSLLESDELGEVMDLETNDPNILARAQLQGRRLSSSKLLQVYTYLH